MLGGLKEDGVRGIWWGRREWLTEEEGGRRRREGCPPFKSWDGTMSTQFCCGGGIKRFGRLLADCVGQNLHLGF